MLPLTLPRFSPRSAILSLPAAAIALSLSAPPAEAIGKNERNFRKGALAVLVIDAILDENRKQQKIQRRAAQPAPVYRQPQDTGRVVYQSIHHTPAAQVFNSYGATDRRRIQQKLASHGYYRSGVDGSFGQGTYSAITAWARDTGQTAALNSREQMYGVYDSLLY
jgi:hypothetical protein